MLIPIKHKYSLDELLAQCDLKVDAPQGLDVWLDAPAVGNEIW
jgi:antitoxin ChpS